MKTPRIALTSGEPAGIGPQLCLAVARETWDCELVCLADRNLLRERARQLNIEAALPTLQHVPLAVESIPGQLDVRNARYVLNLLDQAIDGALAGEFDAIVTAPVHKGIINDAGIAFSGHTEYLAARTGVARSVMLLATDELRVALASTHLPLKAVSAAITEDSLCETLTILDRDLKRLWGFAAPRIAVCGLNPHAGEGGHLGDEEIRVIAPAIERMRKGGVQAFGPLPADTVFVPRVLQDYDAVLTMYHDQGLPVIKHAGFEHAVNVTLGLPIIRTSVDHGTALELAGKGSADAGSLRAAIRLANQFARRSA